MKAACVFGLLFVAAAAHAQDAAPDDAAQSAHPADAAAAEDEPMPRVTTSASADRSGAMDQLVLERTEITGNRELPKVLYIVPWRKPDPGALMGRPVNTLLDEVLAPLDREEFIRQVDYYSDLYGDAGPRAVRAPTAPDSTPEQSTGVRAAGD